MLELAAAAAAVALASFVVTLGVVIALTYLLRSINRASGPDDGEPGDDDGGGGRPRRRPEPPSDPGGDPAWWPEFERELAQYMTQRASEAHR